MSAAEIIVAVLALSLTGFGWLLLRLAEERDRMPYTIASVLMSVDLDRDAEAADQ